MGFSSFALLTVCSFCVSLFYVEELLQKNISRLLHECVFACVCTNSTGQFLSESFLNMHRHQQIKHTAVLIRDFKGARFMSSAPV